jgi:hypothetical protein
VTNTIDPQLLGFVLQLAQLLLIALGVFMAAVTIVYSVMFWRGNFSGDSIARILGHTDIPKLATIIVIVLATSLLGLLGIIAGEAVIALFSGIAGYVLGNQVRRMERADGESGSAAGESGSPGQGRPKS